ncbi:MAG: hypothetical protein QXJ55_04680 [Candidatus Caldarchaeum sp.]
MLWAGVATKLDDEKRADEEITKLLDSVEALSSKYGRKPFLTILSADVAQEYLVERSRYETHKYGVKQILGREEALSA